MTKGADGREKAGGRGREGGQALIRRQAREAVVKALYAFDLGRMNPERALAYVLEDADLPGGGETFAKELLRGVVAELTRLDELIDEYAVGWRIERMPPVDRNVLRLALFEILFRDDIPPGVSANEAVEIAKRYGDEESPKFINGILGEAIRRQGAGVNT